MKDRSVQFPNRYRMNLVPGTSDVYEVVPAPGEISEEGTPINKEALLTDKAAALFGLGLEAVPSEVFLKIASQMKRGSWEKIGSADLTGFQTTAPNTPFEIAISKPVESLCEIYITGSDITGSITTGDPRIFIPSEVAHSKAFFIGKRAGAASYVVSAGMTYAIVPRDPFILKRVPFVTNVSIDGQTMNTTAEVRTIDISGWNTKIPFSLGLESGSLTGGLIEIYGRGDLYD